MKTIAENTYDFERLRKIDAVYVDKTGILHDLIQDPGRQLYFIQRPRRFGKSLMISTLRYIFDARKELFDGLEISKRDYDWKKYPVLQFDFSGVRTNSFETFKEDFAITVSRAICGAGLKYDYDLSPGRNFSDAIQSLKENSAEGVVLLFDEYNAPIGHALHKIELAEAIREEMANFYIQIKANEKCVRFMMMTGVTQFSKMSVFSALNNLSDVSLEPEVAGLLGYTKQELHEYFSEHMRAHAAAMGLDDEKYFEKLKERCDGYHFSSDLEAGVFNPVAIGINMATRGRIFESAWAATGESSILSNYLSSHALASIDYECIANVQKNRLNSCNIKNISVITLLYQSGYLTIKDFDLDFNTYTLGVPNQEVREDLSRLIIYSQKGEEQGSCLFSDLAASLAHADFDEAKELLQSLYAGLTYGPKENTKLEAPYQRILQIVLSAGGFRVQTEVQQAVGRVDVIALHKRGNFVFELKVDKPAELALDQIREKNYTLAYQVGEVPLYAIGLTFDSETRNVRDMQVVRVR